MTTRLNPHVRKSLIISTGVELANRDGLALATPLRVAASCEIETAVNTVRYYFKTNQELWAAIAGHSKASRAVKDEAERLGVL